MKNRVSKLYKLPAAPSFISLILILLLSACQGREAAFLTAENRAWLQDHAAELEVLFGYEAPPNAYHAENGEYVGLLVDYLHEIEGKLGVDFQFRNFETWDELIEYSKTGRNFIIIGIAHTDERAEYLLFTDAFIKVPYVIVTRKDSNLTSMDDLIHSRVCTVENYAVNDYIARYFPQIQPEGVIDNLEGLWFVSTGECDAMIVNQMYATYLVDQQGITNLEITAESGYLNRLSAATSIQDPELFNILEKAVDQIELSRQRELYSKWVSSDAKKPSKTQILMMQIGAVGGGILLIAFWILSIRLRSRVKKQTREIRASEEKYRSVYNTAPLAFVLWDTETRVTDWNTQAEKIFGWKRDDIIGKKFFDFIIPDTVRPQVMEIVDKLLRGESANFSTNQNRTKDGRIIICEWNNAIFHDDEGKVAGVMSLALDITERVIAEERLKNIQAELEERVAERTQELAVRVEQVEQLNQAMTNLLIDLRAQQVSLKSAQDELQAAHEQLQEEHIQEQAALLHLSQGLLKLNDPANIMDFTVQAAAETFHAEFAAIASVEVNTAQPHFSFKAWHGWADEDAAQFQNIPIRNTAMSHAITKKIPIVSSDITQDSYELLAAVREAAIQSRLIVPLIINQQVIGTLALHERHHRQWSDDDIRLASLFANTTAQALERARLFKFEQTARTHAETIARVAQEISASLDLNLILRLVLNNLQNVIAHDTSGIFVAHSDGSWDMVIGPGYDDQETIVKNGKSMIINSPIVQKMQRDLQPVIIPDVRKDKDWIWVEGAEHIRSFIGIPLVARNCLIGVLMIDSVEPNFYSQADLRAALPLVQHVAQAIDNALLFSQVEQGRRRLSRLSQRLVEVQEKERRRIARELHDEVGQLLTALTISLDSISQLTFETPVHERIMDFQALTQELITQINHLSTELRPRVLDDLGLVPGLAALINRVSKQSGIEIDFKHAKVQRRLIAPEVEINAYRLVQESLTNVMRHAGVEKASVRLWMEPDQLCVQVQDEGLGFDLPSAMKSESSMGLVGMAERAELAGGTLDIHSVPGEGTSITASFPLKDNNRKEIFPT